MTWTPHEHSSRQQQDQALAALVATGLEQCLQSSGRAVLAVSGGRSPAGFLQALSQQDIGWQDITVTLVDERCVPDDSPDSNHRLILRSLLQNCAASANLVPLYSADSGLARLETTFRERDLVPLDIAVLGMGTDGHTASLFPCADNIEQLVEAEGKHLFELVQPHTAPWPRITFSLPALLTTHSLFLHIAGEEKRKVLQQALDGSDPRKMPIRAFLHHPDKHIDIHWAP